MRRSRTKENLASSFASENRAYHEAYLDYAGASTDALNGDRRTRIAQVRLAQRNLIVPLLPAVLPGYRTSVGFIGAQRSDAAAL